MQKQSSSIIGKFEVAFADEASGDCEVTVQCGPTVLLQLEYGDASEGRSEYRMLSDLLRDVIRHIQQDPTCLELSSESEETE